MADNEKRLKDLKRQFNEAKNEEIRISTRLEEAKKRRKEATQKIKDKGLEPKQLKSVIADKEKELQDVLDEVETHLPGAASDSDDDDEDFYAEDAD